MIGQQVLVRRDEWLSKICKEVRPDQMAALRSSDLNSRRLFADKVVEDTIKSVNSEITAKVQLKLLSDNLSYCVRVI